MESHLKRIINPWLGLPKDEYNCFGCSPDNPFGLKIECFEDGDDVVCFWRATENYQSWGGTLHGGIQATLIDEVGGWLLCRKMQACGVTVRMNVKYRSTTPAGHGEIIEVRAKVREVKRTFVVVDVAVKHEDKVCTEAELTYCLLPVEKGRALKFNGCKVEGEE